VNGIHDPLIARVCEIFQDKEGKFSYYLRFSLGDLNISSWLDDWFDEEEVIFLSLEEETKYRLCL